MTAIVNTDFNTYQGDTISPIFTVVNLAGAPLDISGVTDIVWTVQRNDSTAAVLTKKKSVAAGISFVTNGTDGKFQVNLVGADTSPLSGFYIHVATIITAGAQSTVTVGRMQVGLPPSWSYDSTQLSSQTVYQVRVLIGDVVEADQQFTDEELAFLLTKRANAFGAAALACRALASKFARSVDMSAGDTKIAYGSMSKQYRAMALDYDQQAAMSGTSGAGGAYAGGISISDKQIQEQNSDRVMPQFNLGMFDNTLPVGEVSNELLDSLPDSEDGVER